MHTPNQALLNSLQLVQEVPEFGNLRRPELLIPKPARRRFCHAGRNRHMPEHRWLGKSSSTVLRKGLRTRRKSDTRRGGRDTPQRWCCGAAGVPMSSWSCRGVFPWLRGAVARFGRWPRSVAPDLSARVAPLLLRSTQGPPHPGGTRRRRVREGPETHGDSRTRRRGARREEEGGALVGGLCATTMYVCVFRAARARVFFLSAWRGQLFSGPRRESPLL